MNDQLTYFLSSPQAMGYAAGSVVAVVLACLIARRLAKAPGTARSRRLMRLLIVALLLVAVFCLVGSYGSTVFQYYVESRKASV
ncbi:hypothetical protein ACQ859_23070 [Roseateles chitinivorans]|uniref:hypothetical protein n=1 Tax=Roseateles chitinivorans TaxID=2917965 RepID=UPI003D67C666